MEVRLISKFTSVVVVGILASSVSLAAAKPTDTRTRETKQAWEWTLEERIAHRTNVELARERVVAAKRTQTSSADNLERRRTVDAFDGKTHPELFLPHEVFEQLISMAFWRDPRSGQLIRDDLLPEIKRHGLPEDFWERLEAVSAVYNGDFWALKDIGAGVREQSGRRRRQAEEAMALKQADICRSGAEAFAAARIGFGRERFDRFLYEVIAVKMFYVAGRLPNPDALRKNEGGCR